MNRKVSIESCTIHLDSEGGSGGGSLSTACVTQPYKIIPASVPFYQSSSTSHTQESSNRLQ